MIEKRLQESRGGYLRPSRALSVAFNWCLALVLTLLALPLMAIIALVILVRDGRPVLYRGERLGKGKDPFTMYKFRTLVPDADRIIGPSLLNDRHKLVTGIGKFLRDTRLDELPQLFNILKGDMEFVGPRPVRPIIYENMCSKIRNYDKRFKIKPGLIGFSQLFTPHTTPKNMRTMIDNSLIKKKEKFLWDILIILYTMGVVAKAVANRCWRYITQELFLCKIKHKYREKREFERVRADSGRVFFPVGADGDTFEGEARLVDINAEAFLMHTEQPITAPFPQLFKLAIPSHRKAADGSIRWKKALCEGNLFRERESEDGHEYVIMYNPVSPLNYYMIRQYFLRESVGLG